MAKYRLEVEVSTIEYVEIEAEDRQDAINKFNKNQYDDKRRIVDLEYDGTLVSIEKFDN